MKKPKTVSSLPIETAKVVESRAAAFQSLKSNLNRAADQAERGELISGDQVFAEIRERSASRRKGQS